MARFRKIDPRIWSDAKFRELSDKAQFLFLMLLTHPHLTMLGAMRATIPGLAAEKGWTAEAFREAFQEALAKGMAEHDERACLVVLPNFLKYNKPESPNVVKSWADALDLLPECSLKTRVIARSKAFAEGLGEAFAKALPEAFAKALPEDYAESGAGAGAGAGAVNPSPTLRASIVRASEGPEAFEVAWREYPKRAGGNPKASAMKAWNARLREGHSEETMLAGVRRYAAYIRAVGNEGTQYVKQAMTFFGPEKHFLEAFAPPEPRVVRPAGPELQGIPTRAGFG